MATNETQHTSPKENISVTLIYSYCIEIFFIST